MLVRIGTRPSGTVERRSGPRTPTAGREAGPRPRIPALRQGSGAPAAAPSSAARCRQASRRPPARGRSDRRRWRAAAYRPADRPPRPPAGPGEGAHLAAAQPPAGHGGRPARPRPEGPGGVTATAPRHRPAAPGHTVSTFERMICRNPFHGPQLGARSRRRQVRETSFSGVIRASARTMINPPTTELQHTGLAANYPSPTGLVLSATAAIASSFSPNSGSISSSGTQSASLSP